MARRKRTTDVTPGEASAFASSGPRPAQAIRAVPERVAPVDALRGLAIAAMIAYHFAFDLRLFGVTRSDFENDPFWLAARASIVTTFLLLVGTSLVLADRAGVRWPRFARRVAVVAACAIAVSIASYVLSPPRYIYFGILHCIAVAMLVARPLVRAPLVATAAGIGIVIAGLVFEHAAFDTRAGSIVGFTTRKPATEDYVPLFPWLGVVLVGAGIGHALVRSGFQPIAPLARAPRALLWMGRHSLAIYMLHQPLLLGALWLLVGRRG